jgi:hypothetical protein
MSQRIYVDDTNQQQRTLERLVPVWTAEMASTADDAWLTGSLAKFYGAWPFVEYGLFLSLAYVVRQCRADTVEFMVAFQAFDHMRLQQDIVQQLYQMGLDVPGFSDEGAREVWMTDPAMTPIREILEHIIASDDWFETLVAINLAFEPLIGSLAKRELFSKVASTKGDNATPAVVAQAAVDFTRAQRCMQALVELVCADPVHGASNRAVIEEWVNDWGARCQKAAAAFIGAFPSETVGADALAATDERYSALRAEMQMAKS